MKDRERYIMLEDGERIQGHGVLSIQRRNSLTRTTYDFVPKIPGF